MFKSTICDKLPARIFENFEIAQVKQWQFENFQNHDGDLFPKLPKSNM